MNVYIWGTQGPDTADTHLHPSSSTASKGRCQLLIWNRCDRLIIFHLIPVSHCTAPFQITRPRQQSPCPNAEQASISSSSFHLAVQHWKFSAQGSEGVSHPKLTIKRNVMHCACEVIIASECQLPDYYDLLAVLWLQCQSTKSDFIGSIMPQSEITLPSSHCIVLLLLLLVGFIPPEETHNVTPFSFTDEWKNAMLS